MLRIWLLFCLLLGAAAPVFGNPLGILEFSDFPSLISGSRIDGPLYFCDEPVPFEKQEVRERLEKELLLMLWNRPQVILWMKRSGRYFPHIEKILQQGQMPADLKFIAIIESDLRPHVGSYKGAIGYWQFMKSTGKKYGLKINADLDQRRNIFTSTRAAADYFQELYAILGSWTLSAAAFNMGEGGLQAEVMAQKTDNYYDLYLPLETQRYVLRAVAAKLILSSPEKYGFRLQREDLYPVLEFDRIKLKVTFRTPIHLIAQATGTSFKAIKDLNPEIRGHHLTRGTHSILIPKESAQGFHARYKELVNQWQAKNAQHIYVVKKGDNLSLIADRFSVPLPVLAIWNRLNLNKPIYPGQRLTIYPGKTTPAKGLKTKK
jgi:membrane-bound lytic murein transglycosylase D